MKSPQAPLLRFCFIGPSPKSYLIEYIHLNRNDRNREYSFENLNLMELRAYDPHVIVIDEYFNDRDYSTIIQSIKRNFKGAKIYLLSPQYAGYQGIFQSLNHKNHYYSNFSIDIINHINSLSDDRTDYLEAS